MCEQFVRIHFWHHYFQPVSIHLTVPIYLKRLLHYYNKLKRTHFLLLRLIGISLILINSSNTIFENGKYFFLLLNLFVNRTIVLRPPVYHRPFTIFISN